MSVTEEWISATFHKPAFCANIQPLSRWQPLHHKSLEIIVFYVSAGSEPGGPQTSKKFLLESQSVTKNHKTNKNRHDYKEMEISTKLCDSTNRDAK